MALDPNISLNVNTGNSGANFLAPVEQGMRLAALGMQPALIQQQIESSRQGMLASQQQIEASKTAQQVSQAQLPGIQAESATKKRVADFAKWQTDNTGKYINADGTPNIDKFVNHAAQSGYFTEAQSVAASELENKGKAALTASTEQTRAIAQADFLKSSLGYTATLLDAAPANKRSALLKQYADFADAKVPGTGAQLLQAFGRPDPKTGIPTVDSEKISAFKKSTMTPLEAGNLAVSQQNAATSAESVRQSGVVNVASPEARDKNSTQSNAMREWGRNAGIQGITDAMSAADIANLPGYKDAVAASVVPAATKAEAVRGAVSGLQAANIYLSAKSAVDKLVKRGLMKGDTTLGTFFEQNKERLTNDPDFRAAQAALAKVTETNPTITFTTVNPTALSAQLEKESNLALKQAKTASQVAPATTFNKALPDAQEPTPEEPPRKMYKPGEIVNGRPVMTQEQAIKMPKGFKFADIYGDHRTRN